MVIYMLELMTMQMTSWELPRMTHAPIKRLFEHMMHPTGKMGMMKR